jgi:hypothetical protein
MPIVMTYDDAIIRYRLRLARTGIRVLTDSDEERRTNTFWAALQQFEELLDAAGTVGPASRPLPLFYALSQAGRAITAAHAPARWELRGHGLKLSGDSSQNLLERPVRPEPRRAGDDSFQRVAQTVGSDVLNGPVELGAVWASLPFDFPEAWAQRWPEALSVESLVKPSEVATDEVAAQVTGFDRLTEDAIRQRLELYPSAQGWQLPGGDQLIGEQTPQGWSAWLVWRANGTTTDDRLAKLAQVAPEYRRRGQRWLRPAVGTQRDYLKPLCAWWVLLYALSMAARYEPASWTNALAINSSNLAAPLESLLDDAMLDIPQLVLEALEEQQFLVS